MGRLHKLNYFCTYIRINRSSKLNNEYAIRNLQRKLKLVFHKTNGEQQLLLYKAILMFALKKQSFYANNTRGPRLHLTYSPYSTGMRGICNYEWHAKHLSNIRSCHLSNIRSCHLCNTRSCHLSNIRTCHLSNIRSCHLCNIRSCHLCNIRSCHLCNVRSCHLCNMRSCHLSNIRPCHLSNIRSCHLSNIRTCHLCNVKTCIQLCYFDQKKRLNKLDVDPRRDDDASPMSSYRCM